MNEDAMSSFPIESIFPEHVINSQGIKEPFQIEDIKRKLRIQTGLDEEVAQSISDQVVKKILISGMKEIESSKIRDLVCTELSIRGLDSYKSLFDYDVQRFFLDDDFIDAYRGSQPNWGPLGYITYKRTYARLKPDGSKEEFWETIQRVVNGCYSIQKTHCKSLEIPWNEDKAQRSAQRMYEKIWNFKFLPPGRGLWIMGTDFVRRHGSMSLNNCGYVSTSNLDLSRSKPFEFMMDASMLGVGVGFDVKGAGKIEIKEPAPGKFTFVVPDSREGWVQGMRLILEAFFDGKQVPEFDYSLLRPKGAPIKGFGGYSSGPEPLKEMYDSIEKLLCSRVGFKIKVTDIVDIMNFIGKAVVSGNVRRSAQIALGSPDDTEYITMKDPDLHGDELMDRRWASNNSVIVDPDEGIDYTFIAEAIAKNGEPGIVWLNNARKYSRINGVIDWKDKKVAGVNPCFSGDTLIAVSDGRGAISIKELADAGKDVPVYSLNRDGMVEIKMGRHPRVTGHDKELLRITFEDGTSMKVTPDHGMILLNGTRVEAKALQVGDNLPRFTRRSARMGNKKYLRVWKNTIERRKDKEYEHRIIARFNDEHRWNELYEEGIKNGYAKTGGIVVHHRDGNTLNNDPANLEIKPFNDHYDDHGFFDVEGEKNPMHGKRHSEETKQLIGERTRERCQDDDFKEKLRQSIKDGMDNNETREKISDARHRYWMEFYEEFEKNTDLETVWIGDQLFVRKNCEACGKEMTLEVGRREQCYCSLSCGNKKEESIEARKEGQRAYFEDKQRNTLHDQINAFKDLKKRLGRDPMKKEWETECRSREIPFRLNKHSTNPRALKNYTDLKERAITYNHRVAKIETIKTRENVYNITVDDNHTVGVILSHDSDSFVSNGVFTTQCGEQSLYSWELCCLVESFPSLNDSLEEFLETLKYAYLYAKSVTLMRTHWKETNAVMLKNRRIGTSMSGIIDAIARHGRRELLRWCEKGYEFLQELDEEYSNWLCVPRSVKITTIKPSGTTSLLPGVSAGIHYPHSEYYIRRIRIAKDSELIPILKEAGYPMEESVTDQTTMVVDFPVHESNFQRGKRDVSMEMQVMNAIDFQRYWSDNQVSITVTFNKDEAGRIKDVLEMSEDKLKGISFLPISDHGYQQAPYEEISKERYEEMAARIKPMNLEGYNEVAVGVRGCDSDHCEL